MADGDDIRYSNETVPVWPEGMTTWQKIRCALGHHKPEVRFAPRRIRTMDGRQLGITRLRDQCGICQTLMNTQIKDSIRVAKARAHAEAQPVQARWSR